MPLGGLNRQQSSRCLQEHMSGWTLGCTFDSDDAGEAEEIKRADSSDSSSFRPRRVLSSTSLARNCRRTVTRRRQTDTLSIASSSMRSRASSGSPYYDRRRESTASGGRDHSRTTTMLVAVVLCFVVVELPQGLLAFQASASHFQDLLCKL